MSELLPERLIDFVSDLTHRGERWRPHRSVNALRACCPPPQRIVSCESSPSRVQGRINVGTAFLVGEFEDVISPREERTALIFRHWVFPPRSEGFAGSGPCGRQVSKRRLVNYLSLATLVPLVREHDQAGRSSKVLRADRGPRIEETEPRFLAEQAEHRLRRRCVVKQDPDDDRKPLGLVLETAIKGVCGALQKAHLLTQALDEVIASEVVGQAKVLLLGSMRIKTPP
jgi:hypothetical protein